MADNRSSGRVIRTIIVILCIINIAFLVIASRRGAGAVNIFSGGSSSSGASGTAATSQEEYASSAETAREASAANAESGDHDGTPYITLSDDLPDLTQDDLDDVVPVLKEAGSIYAGDGNGNDITDDIDALTTAHLDNLGDFTLRFSVTDDNGETAEASADVTVDITKPILELSANRITLERGADFEELSYVDTAVDEDGDDLSRGISIDGDVDTSTAGTYEVTYSIRSARDDARAEKTLEVTVE